MKKFIAAACLLSSCAGFIAKECEHNACPEEQCVEEQQTGDETRDVAAEEGAQADEGLSYSDLTEEEQEQYDNLAQQIRELLESEEFQQLKQDVLQTGEWKALEDAFSEVFARSEYAEIVEKLKATNDGKSLIFGLSLPVKIES